MKITVKQKYEAPEITDFELNDLMVVQGGSKDSLPGTSAEDPLA